MAESVVLIRAIKHDPFCDKVCIDKIFPDRFVYVQPVSGYHITNPRSSILREGFTALAACQNPILWIDHHGIKNNKNCSYPDLRISEPINMAKLIWQNAGGISFQHTLQIYQFSCYAGQYHIQLLASELKRLGLRNFNVWGCPDKIYIFNKPPYFRVDFNKLRNTKLMDDFWKKKNGGCYAYADRIKVDSEGKMHKEESIQTRKIREYQQQQQQRQKRVRQQMLERVEGKRRPQRPIRR